MKDPRLSQKDRQEWLRLINLWIFDKKDRAALEWALLDGDTISEIAERIGLGEKQTQRRIKDAKNELFSHM